MKECEAWGAVMCMDEVSKRWGRRRQASHKVFLNEMPEEKNRAVAHYLETPHLGRHSQNAPNPLGSVRVMGDRGEDRWNHLFLLYKNCAPWWATCSTAGVT